MGVTYIDYNTIVYRCILDGEMLVWDRVSQRFAEFGSNRGVGKDFLFSFFLLLLECICGTKLPVREYGCFKTVSMTSAHGTSVNPWRHLNFWFCPEMLGHSLANVLISEIFYKFSCTAKAAKDGLDSDLQVLQCCSY